MLIEVSQIVSALHRCQDRPRLARSLAGWLARSTLSHRFLSLSHVVDVGAWPPGTCLVVPPLPFFSTLNKVLVDASLQSRLLTLFSS